MLPHGDAAAPSMSQTSTGNVTNIAGQTLIGAKPKVDAAPARTAISDLRQPHARMIGWARLNQFTAAAPSQALADRARLRQPRSCLPPFAKKPVRRPARPLCENFARCRGAPRGAHKFAPASPAADRHRESRSRTDLGPATILRAPARGRSA